MLQDHAIIIGFGVPGRAAAEVLDLAGVAYIVIELNAVTVARLGKAHTRCIEGDGRDAESLRSAGIESARLVLVAIPDERRALEIVSAVRQINTTVHIVARCHYTSSGLEALRLGATEVVVAEQAVALELGAMVGAIVEKRAVT